MTGEFGLPLFQLLEGFFLLLLLNLASMPLVFVLLYLGVLPLLQKPFLQNLCFMAISLTGVLHSSYFIYISGLIHVKHSTTCRVVACVTNGFYFFSSNDGRDEFVKDFCFIYFW